MSETGSPVRCWNCGKEITDLDDLMVVVWFGLKLEPLCSECYVRREKGYSYHLFTAGKPVNHGLGSLGLILSPVLVLVWLGLLRIWSGKEWHTVWPVIKWVFLGLFCLSLFFGPLVRLRSYLAFERPLIKWIEQR